MKTLKLLIKTGFFDKIISNLSGKMGTVAKVRPVGPFVSGPTRCCMPEPLVASATEATACFA